jgi:hypothetical protein
MLALASSELWDESDLEDSKKHVPKATLQAEIQWSSLDLLAALV